MAPCPSSPHRGFEEPQWELLRLSYLSLTQLDLGEGPKTRGQVASTFYLKAKEKVARHDRHDRHDRHSVDLSIILWGQLH